MAILVTGAAGFLGSHLTDRLLEIGHKVIGLDNFYTGSYSNIEHLSSNSNFEFIEHDINIPISINVEGIFNLACPASPIQYQKNPVETIRTNFVGAYNCLQLATQNNAKVLQASTSEVYGDPLISPQSESYWGNVNPIGIRSCYDEGKRAAETLFFDFYREHKTRIKVARIFNTYGPRMNFQDGRVVSNFIFQALKKEPLTIYGDGYQTRSFCYVDDLISGLISLYETEDGVVGPINLGNPNEFTILDLGNLVNDITGNTRGFEFKALPGDDPKQRKPEISLATQILSWRPSIELESGLKRTVADFEKRLAVSNF